MGVVRLDDISFGDEDVDEALQLWRKAIEAAMNWKITGHCSFTATPDGSALHVKGATRVKIAKVGATAIPAMATLTPGSGSATFYDMGATALAANQTETVFNTEFSPIAAGAWIKVIEVDGRWFIYESPRAHVALNGASTIPAMSGTTPGSGTVTLQSFAGSTLSSNGTVTAYNTTATAVAASKYLQIKRIDGYWFVDVESC